MDIQFRTESEELLRREVAGASHRSVEQAVSLLQAQASWLAGHRAEQNTGEDEERSGLR